MGQTMHAKSIEQLLLVLQPILGELKRTKSIEEKLKILSSQSIVRDFYSKPHPLLSFFESLSDSNRIVVNSIIVIGQADHVFSVPPGEAADLKKLKEMIDCLLEVEQFYENIGGVVGYHVKVLELMEEKKSAISTKLEFMKPEGLNLSKNLEEANFSVLQGLAYLPSIGEIYPIGGAGDRLGLHDENTGEALPAALLMFCGHTLIEGLMRDLQAREYLYFKLFGNQLQTPVALMTSREKNNHQHLLEVFEQKQWFGRPHQSFSFFDQPLVPLVTIEGEWVMKSTFDLALKPGGHGVIWKLAKERGVFEWFYATGRREVIVRQINNPMAGIDSGMLAFIGRGCDRKKSFGFLSCPRQVKSAEGTLVCVAKNTSEGVEYRISNLEYTSFPLYGIEDIPEIPGESFSLYPSNTNILFASLKEIEAAMEICPIPGMLINLKTGVNAVDAEGKVREVKAARLESTMQNISDHLVVKSQHALHGDELEKALSTFVVYNERLKTISVTKNSYIPGKSIQETPEGAYFDLLRNMSDLLANHCQVQVPPVESAEQFLTKGPDLIVLYHPALGPLYQVIAQKIRGGILHKGAELQLEIAELDIENLELDGSLLIFADSVMGKTDHGDILRYSHENGKCVLHNVKVVNKGREKRPDQIFWKNQLLRHECLKITLHGNAEFEAKDVVISGHHELDVPDGYKMTAHQENGQVSFQIDKISRPTWEWSYSVSKQNTIELQKKVN